SDVLGLATTLVLSSDWFRGHGPGGVSSTCQARFVNVGQCTLKGIRRQEKKLPIERLFDELIICGAVIEIHVRQVAETQGIKNANQLKDLTGFPPGMAAR